jgi:hypothetical protein
VVSEKRRAAEGSRADRSHRDELGIALPDGGVTPRVWRASQKRDKRVGQGEDPPVPAPEAIERGQPGGRPQKRAEADRLQKRERPIGKPRVPPTGDSRRQGGA